MFKDENRHYSLRKLSVGLASVLIGISFASGMNGNSVKADTVKDDSNGVQTVKVNDAVAKDSNAAAQGSDAVAKTDAGSAPEGQNQTPEASKNNSGAITQDLKLNTVNTEAKQQNEAIQSSDVAGSKALKANNYSIAQEDSSETTLNLKGTKFIDPKTLEENKTEAAIKADPANGVDPVKFAANGGFDPAIWGTMDTSKWQLDNNGNITGYTGNMKHIIIPNSADFAKAGKNYQQISISSDEMKKLLRSDGKDYEVYYDTDTLAISLTNDNKVKATNADWSNVFTLSKLKQANLEELDTSTVTNMSYMFDESTELTNLDVSNWDTSNVTNMSSMFSVTLDLTSLDVSNWNTSKVTDMSGMFGSAEMLTSLDVSKWDTGKVTNMSGMFSYASGLTSLDVSKWDTSKVTDMSTMFNNARSLTSLDVSNWNTSNVTDMHSMFSGASSHSIFSGASSLTSLDVSKWNTSKVTDMSNMFNSASRLTNLDVSNWDTSKVTDMYAMFNNASGLTNLDVSKWDTGNVTNMFYMFNSDPNLALIVNGDKFADYLVKNNFANSRINSDVKSVTTDNTKLLKLLANDVQHKFATKTIVFTFPAGYSPDLTKYHLIKVGNTYQIKQSADYTKSYAQGTVLINATEDIAKHHIDTTKQNKLSDTWQPNYDKLVLAHKNADGTVSFDDVQLPQIPGYKTVVKTASSPVNHVNALFAVSFMALPNPVAPVQNDAKPAKIVTPVTPATEAAELIKTEPKVATTPKAIDLSNNVVATTPDVSTWQVANDLKHDTYHVSNGRYTVELPHISNAQLHVIANDSTKDSILFGYKGQNSKYVFKIKFVNGHYLLTTYKIKSGKLVKLIDYNFIKSSKVSDVILDWINLK